MLLARETPGVQYLELFLEHVQDFSLVGNHSALTRPLSFMHSEDRCTLGETRFNQKFTSSEEGKNHVTGNDSSHNYYDIIMM